MATGTPSAAPAPSEHQADHARAAHEVSERKAHGLEAADLGHDLGPVGATFTDRIRTLLNWRGTQLENKKARQFRESGHANDDEATISAVTSTVDPHTIRHQIENQFLHNHHHEFIGNINIVPPVPLGGAALPAVPFSVDVEYHGHDFWNLQRSADEIFTRINGRTLAQLHDELGIDLTSLTTGATPVIRSLDENAARQLAQLLYVPYLRANFGDSSETNIGHGHANGS